MGDHIVDLLFQVLGRIVADEVKALLPVLSQRVLELAVRLEVPERRARRSEEWGAYLLEVRGDLFKLFSAADFVRASLSIRFYEWQSAFRERLRTRVALYVFVLVLISLSLRSAIKNAFGASRDAKVPNPFADERILAFVCLIVMFVGFPALRKTMGFPDSISPQSPTAA